MPLTPSAAQARNKTAASGVRLQFCRPIVIDKIVHSPASGECSVAIVLIVTISAASNMAHNTQMATVV